ncbi:MAG: hypothetical protein EOL88_00685 [Bacteroidia bacterium]|nr:hypothetical protein [Bacteroidia bacterium]
MAKTTYTPTRTFNLYGGSITIDFYEKYGRYSHVYIRRDNGEWLKSVTGATGMIDKPLLIPWACKEMGKALVDVLSSGGVVGEPEINQAKNAWRTKRDKSAEKGSIIHDLVSEYIKYKLGERKTIPAIPKDPEIKNAYLAFRDWEKEHNVKFIATEKLVYSKKYNFVGTLDCIAEVDGEYCLIDFKSGNGIYWDFILQVGGYGLAHEEEFEKKFDRNWIVRFGKENAEFAVKSFKSDPRITKGYLSCLYLKNIQKEMEALVQ